MDTGNYEEPEDEVLYDDTRECEEVPDRVRWGFFWMNLAAKFSRHGAGLGQRRWLVRLSQGLRKLPIANDFMLIVSPSKNWEDIARRAHGWIGVFVTYFLPLSGLMALLDGTGLYLLGCRQMAEGMTENRFSIEWIFVFELVQLCLTILLILAAACCVNMFGNTCHRRIRLSRSLLLLVYAAGPLLLAQCFNVIPGLNAWITWIIGLVLSLGALYHGLPRILKPDVPSAMGLFISSAVIFVLLMFIGRLLTYLDLVGDFKRMDDWVGFLAIKLQSF